MEIKEAVRSAREEAELLKMHARSLRTLGANMIASSKEWNATAIEAVCDALEAFLRKQEEDSSYHSR